jgi:MFS family permease
LVLVAASVASSMVALDLLVVTTALETIRTDLVVSTSALQWTITAYSVSFAALLMTGAALGDRFGRRPDAGLPQAETPRRQTTLRSCRVGKFMSRQRGGHRQSVRSLPT